MAELVIGKHCSITSCNLLDFLPFECDGCKATYCKNHKEKSAHNCPKSSTITNENREKVFAKYRCSFGDCRNEELVPVKCSLCSQLVCLKHRNPEEHNCVKLPPKRNHQSALTATTSQPIKLKTKFKTEKAERMAAKVAVMKLKQKAVGNKGLPQSERVYLSIQVTNHEPIAIFVSDKWTVGKIIDYTLEELKITNTNNTDTDYKFKLCSMRTGQVFLADKQLKFYLDKGIIFNGSYLLMDKLSNDVCTVEP